MRKRPLRTASIFSKERKRERERERGGRERERRRIRKNEWKSCLEL